MLKLKTVFCLLTFIFLSALIGNSGVDAQGQLEESGYVIDSDLSFEEAVSGKKIPNSILDDLSIVNVYYYGFDARLHKGQLVVHKEVVLDIIEIFEFIREDRFPIGKVVPINRYDWSDEKSMLDNNTSAFNYRFISGTRVISNHAIGLAIDINPMLNPYIKNGNSLPEKCVYDTTKPGTISASSQLVVEFKSRGWKWGGDWESIKDYQHFEKKLK